MNRKQARAFLALAAWAIACCAISTGAFAQPDGAIAVSRGTVDSQVSTLAPGLSEWVRQQLVAAGAPVVAGAKSREATASLAGGQRSTSALISRLAGAGAKRALIVDLRWRAGTLEVDLRLHATSDAGLLAAAHTTGSAAELTRRIHGALEQMAPRMRLRQGALPAATDVTADELAAATHALEALAKHELATGWRQVGTKKTPFTVQIRSEIEGQAGASNVSPAERARLLAVRGDAEAAWSMISGQAKAAVRLPKPKQRDPARAHLLLSAGEVLLELGRLREARMYFEKALAADPKSADAALLLGRIFRLQRTPAPARKVLAYAARLAPGSPRPLMELAELEAANPGRQAEALLRAGERAAKSFDTRAAQSHLDRAMRTDPAVTAAAGRASGSMHERLGHNIEALRAFKRAAGASGGARGSADVARVQRALSDELGAEATLASALELDSNDPDLLLQLGRVYAATERRGEAVVQLERALELSPGTAETRRALAGVLQETGDTKRALDLRTQVAASPGAREDDLMALALLQRELGDEAGAQRSLDRAVGTRELALHVHPELTRTLADSGDGIAAGKARELAAIMGEDFDSAGKGDEPAGDDAASRFAALVRTFATRRSDDRAVVLLGLREKLEPRELARDWLNPKTPDLDRLGDELADALARSFSLKPTPEFDIRIVERVDALFDFDDTRSRDAAGVVAVNESLGTSAIFLARLYRHEGGGASKGCGEGPYFEVQLRALSGQTHRNVRLLGNSACLPGGLEAHGIWNLRAAGVYAALAFACLWLVVRGWGTVIVDFKLPPQSKALFSVSLSKRPRKVKDKSARRRGTASWLFEKRLNALSRYERRLDGKQSIFRWIPARRRDYYLAVRGPLVDYTSDRLIGDFLEERQVRVKSWRATRIEFDMTPTECAVDVSVTDRGNSLGQGRVALKGHPNSLRYTHDGSAFIYAGPGEHVILAGSVDSVVQRRLLIEMLDPISIQMDISETEALVFSDCPEAVSSYLEGDFAGAAGALEAAGQTEVANRIRAEWHEGRGDRRAAAAAYQAAGDLTQSAELRSAESDLEGSAELWEEAGEFAKAAAAYRDSGDLVSAARAYEAAYDYASALDCYRELGETEKVIALLETSGDPYEAASEAAQVGQVDRAIHNLQQVDQRHAYYSEACRTLGSLLAERGEKELAVEKLGEALDIAGADNASLDELELYGKLLQEMGRPEDALTVYEKIRRRDLNYGDVNTRIESLRSETQRAAATPMGLGAAAAAAVGGPGTAESRYEIVGELGRGGMGVVFKARDRQLGRIVALKVLPENLRDHPQVLELFEREARAAAALNHQNIVTIFDAGREGDTVFMTMECLDGVGLDAVLKKRGVIPARAVAGLGAQVAKGLEYARQQKIVHRDIKPSNLFLTRDKVVKIMDFGLAKTIEEVRRSSTMIGGTPNFMAPEQASGEPVDHRTDLYSLGASLFQLVTGGAPFVKGDLAYHHRHTPAPDPRERNPSVPAAIAELVLKMMEKRPEDRVQTAGEVEALLVKMLAR